MEPPAADGVKARAPGFARLRPRRTLLKSSTFRVTITFITLFTIAVMLVMSFVYWSGAGFMSDQVDTTIEAEIESLRDQYVSEKLNGVLSAIDKRLQRMPTTNTIYLVRAPDGELMGGNLDRWPDREPDTGGWIEFPLHHPDMPESGAHRARSRVFRLPGEYGLLVGRDMSELDLVQRRLRSALLLGLAGVIVLGVAGSVLTSRGILRRIDTINRTSAEIMAGDLSRRIPTTDGSEDLDRLGQNLNGMLDRIELLMSSVRQVSDNIAHDLKTPLTRLRNRLDELHREAVYSGQGADPRIEQSVSDADSLLETFSALLRIARLESGQPLACESVILDSVLDDVSELYEPVASDRNITLLADCDIGVKVQGDRNLLFQAFANLLDNAIKYTPPGGRVEVQLRRPTPQAPKAVVSVRDSGPGVPEDERGNVTRRFYRLDQSRNSPGTGLGLSLVQAVCRLHGARIRFSEGLGEAPDPPGLGVHVTFEQASPGAPDR